MIKKEENQQSLNINFKIKVSSKYSKEEAEKWATKEINDKLAQDLIDKINQDPLLSSVGIYAQLKNEGNTVDYRTFTLAMMEEALFKLYKEKDKEQKQVKKNEYRKRFNFQSKILKQTYKFRQ